VGETVKKDQYNKSINEMIEYFQEPSIEKEIIAAYPGGSVARGDFTPGRSDIDIYVVISNRTQEIAKFLKEKADHISSNCLNALLTIHQEPITIALTTMKELKKKRKFFLRFTMERPKHLTDW
jgi:predicted nucleotidyltransferase